MQRRFPIAAFVLAPLALTVAMAGLGSLAGCEKKNEAAPAASAPAAAPAASSAAPAGSGATRTVAFQLDSAAPVGALQIDVQYSGAGRFVGDADGVACETKIDGALSSYNHIVDQKMLRAAFVAVKGFAGPVTISECKFQGDAKPEDFKVSVKDSSSPDLAELNPPPSIKVTLN